MTKKSAAFPVGLYAMLLLALVWLTLPRVFAPIERWMVGSACLVPRVASAWFGEPASAADRNALARIRELGEQLTARVRQHDFAGAGISMKAGDDKLLCGVLSVGRRGGAGQPSELLLDHTYAELAGCREIVTKGGALLGFLLKPGVGRAIDDTYDDPARVMLCNHRDAPRLYASLQNRDGSQLRFVIKPAAVVDPAPLRVDFWDDPYRAAQLRETQQRVFTLPVTFGKQRVPGGLLVGRTRRWGYEGDGDEPPLTIGMFVTPAVEARALSHVVVWRSGDVRQPVVAAASVLRSRRRATATVYDLPGASHGRHLLVCTESVPDGAAVVQDGLFLGTARGLCLGSGLVTSFVASRQAWTLLLLPDGDAEPPIELHARVERTVDNVAWLKLTGVPLEQLARVGRGYLFTGSNGQFCPAGLWIGLAEPAAEGFNVLKVTVPMEAGPRSAEVLVGESPR
jgi:hypothetical protein